MTSKSILQVWFPTLYAENVWEQKLFVCSTEEGLLDVFPLCSQASSEATVVADRKSSPDRMLLSRGTRRWRQFCFFLTNTILGLITSLSMKTL